MLGSVSTFNTNEHALIGGDLGAFLARLAKKTGRDFAVIRYHELGVFCIVEFLSPHRDVFVDTMNLGESLANFDREKRQELERRVYRPLTCDETSRQIAEADSDYHHGRQNDQEEETERMAKCAVGE